VGGLVDVLDPELGAWFEARIVNIYEEEATGDGLSSVPGDGRKSFTYAITFDE